MPVGRPRTTHARTPRVRLERSVKKDEGGGGKKKEGPSDCLLFAFVIFTSPSRASTRGRRARSLNARRPRPTGG